jgi:hypothetical protein
MPKFASIGPFFRLERPTATDVCGANQSLCKASVADYSTKLGSKIFPKKSKHSVDHTNFYSTIW